MKCGGRLDGHKVTSELVSDVLWVILAHDVDWSSKGPGMHYILARKDRFDEVVIARVVNEGYNPYSNILDLIVIEDRYGVKSIFLFRPECEHGILMDACKDSLIALVSEGWATTSF